MNVSILINLCDDGKIKAKLTPSLSNLCTILSLILAWISAGMRIDTFLPSPLPSPSIQQIRSAQNVDFDLNLRTFGITRLKLVMPYSFAISTKRTLA